VHTSSPKEKRFTDSSAFLNLDAHLSPINEKNSTSSLHNNSMEIEICGRRVVYHTYFKKSKVLITTNHLIVDLKI